MVERAARVPSRRARVRRVLWGVGTFLLVAGLLVLAFWAYLVWGTAVGQHAAQTRLSTALDRHYEVPTAPTASSPTTEPRAATPNGPFVWPALANGDPVVRLVIPRIGLDMVVVEGTETADLREGPGHYPMSPLPGQPGNVAIAGHRTTYAHPFYNLNELSPGDVIVLSVPGHDWRYLVTAQMVVAPSDVAVAGPFGPGSWLTLTTCNPRYSAATRLVVRAQLASSSAPAGPAPVPVVSSTADPKPPAHRAPAPPEPGGRSWWSVFGWGALLAALAVVAVVAWRTTGRRLWRVCTCATAGVVGLICLWGLFGALASLLPAGY